MLSWFLDGPDWGGESPWPKSEAHQSLGSPIACFSEAPTTHAHHGRYPAIGTLVEARQHLAHLE